MHLVVVKTVFLSGAREAECREAPSRGVFALSPSRWRAIRKWQSHQYVSSTTSTRDANFLYGRLFSSKF